MKLKHTLSMVLLAIGSLFRFGGNREEVSNVASSVGTSENGTAQLLCSIAAITQRYLLVQPGASPGVNFIVNVATTRPLGVVMDEPAIGECVTIQLLGVKPGTMKMVANGAITAGSMLYTAAAGKVSPTYAATAFLVGRALTAAAADGELIEVQHRFPLINAAATL
jgi:hypothetical protein